MSQEKLTPTPFIHPVTKEALFKAADGALVLEAQPDRPVCGEMQEVYDFASMTHNEGDRPHYDGVYARKSAPGPPVPWEDLERQWRTSPDLRPLLASLEDLEGKTVLLLGNGVSCKEFYFLPLGARCIYTDLSISAVHAAQKTFLTSGWAERFGDRIEFHAIDALHLPFAEASFDLVYFCTRGTLKLGGQFLLPVLQPLCRSADTVLDHCCGFTHKHGVRLVWGFHK